MIETAGKQKGNASGGEPSTIFITANDLNVRTHGSSTKKIEKRMIRNMLRLDSWMYTLSNSFVRKQSIEAKDDTYSTHSLAKYSHSNSIITEIDEDSTDVRKTTDKDKNVEQKSFAGY